LSCVSGDVLASVIDIVIIFLLTNISVAIFVKLALSLNSMHFVCVTGDVLNKYSGHLRDVSKSSLRGRPRSEVDRVSRDIRCRQRCDG